ncbi:MAG: DNA polymerase III subunit delta [Alloprevotella sp.]|nr:DNA polymerase III subunit delta [Alloprevotella sp.]
MAYSPKAPAVTHETIVRDVRAGKIAPVYYLMGEEGYYIDRVADFLVDSVLREDEKAFNLITVFGLDTDIDAVMDAAKGFPMGAQRQVVVVKEAQNLKNIDRLEYYLRQPQPSTVLIFCHKNGALDRRKKLPGLIERAGGVVFESKKLYESQLAPFITAYLKRKGAAIQPDAVAMMAEYVGADLSRMAGELDKLCIALPPGGGQAVTTDLVASHIGISKEFNIFELQEALGAKNVLKAMRIANYFDKNPKANPIQKTLPSLFRFFSHLMLAHYAPDKSERGLAGWLGMGEWQVRRNVFPALRNYNAVKVMQILGEIRRTDARSKGVGNPSITNGDLMRELLYFILH